MKIGAEALEWANLFLVGGLWPVRQKGAQVRGMETPRTGGCSSRGQGDSFFSDESHDSLL